MNQAHLDLINTVRDSDQIKMFAEDALVRCTEKGMQPAALYKLYTSWASAYGVKADNNIVLGKRLKQMGPEKTRSNGKDYCVRRCLLLERKFLSSALLVSLIFLPRKPSKGQQMSPRRHLLQLNRHTIRPT